MTPVQRLPEPRADFRPRPRMLHPGCPIEQSLPAAVRGIGCLRCGRIGVTGESNGVA